MDASAAVREESHSETPKRNAVVAAAHTKDGEDLKDKLSIAERADATAWFLEGSPEEPCRVDFQINVGKDSKHPHWINWAVRALDRDRIQEIRDRAADEFESIGKAGTVANTRITTEATIVPDLKEVRGEYGDPAIALEARFAFKPGLIDQIAQKVLRATGYEDTDVREVDAVKN